MDTVIDQKNEALVGLARAFAVEELYAFGSGIREDFAKGQSDVDFLVRFSPCTPVEHADRYFGLLLALEALFETKVDLVEIDAIRNPYFREEVESTRRLIYAA